MILEWFTAICVTITAVIQIALLIDKWVND